jgi:hypothetical protein
VSFGLFLEKIVLGVCKLLQGKRFCTGKSDEVLSLEQEQATANAKTGVYPLRRQKRRLGQ